MSMHESRPALLLLNGAPGSGKSTIVTRVAAERPLALALDVDTLKHSLGGWDQDLQASGLQARRLALALARQHLEDRHDVLIGQYLARPAFLAQLQDLAHLTGARFVEAALVADADTLAHRLAARRRSPDRPEQVGNDRFVRPEDAPELVDALTRLLATRPVARRIDATGSVEEITAEVTALLGP